MVKTLSGVTLLAMLVAACAGGDRPVAGPATSPAALADWRTVATGTDRDRLRRWRDAWTAGLAQARAGGAGRAIDAEGVLLRPDAALGDPAPPPGAYRCRVIKIGSRAGTTPPYIAYPPYACRIDDEGSVDGFHKVGGSQRPQGLLFPDGPTRQVFVGTLLLGDETRAVAYGADRDRDMIGMMERVAPRRWRLALPHPRFESLIDIIELVPAD